MFKVKKNGFTHVFDTCPETGLVGNRYLTCGHRYELPKSDSEWNSLFPCPKCVEHLQTLIGANDKPSKREAESYETDKTQRKIGKLEKWKKDYGKNEIPEWLQVVLTHISLQPVIGKDFKFNKKTLGLVNSALTVAPFQVYKTLITSMNTFAKELDRLEEHNIGYIDYEEFGIVISMGPVLHRYDVTVHFDFWAIYMYSVMALTDSRKLFPVFVEDDLALSYHMFDLKSIRRLTADTIMLPSFRLKEVGNHKLYTEFLSELSLNVYTPDTILESLTGEKIYSHTKIVPNFIDPNDSSFMKHIFELEKWMDYNLVDLYIERIWLSDPTFAFVQIVTPVEANVFGTEMTVEHSMTALGALLQSLYNFTLDLRVNLLLGSRLNKNLLDDFEETLRDHVEQSGKYPDNPFDGYALELLRFKPSIAFIKSILRFVPIFLENIGVFADTKVVRGETTTKVFRGYSHWQYLDKGYVRRRIEYIQKISFLKGMKFDTGNYKHPDTDNALQKILYESVLFYNLVALYGEDDAKNLILAQFIASVDPMRFFPMIYKIGLDHKESKFSDVNRNG